MPTPFLMSSSWSSGRCSRRSRCGGLAPALNSSGQGVGLRLPVRAQDSTEGSCCAAGAPLRPQGQGRVWDGPTAEGNTPVRCPGGGDQTAAPRPSLPPPRPCRPPCAHLRRPCRSSGRPPAAARHGQPALCLCSTVRGAPRRRCGRARADAEVLPCLSCCTAGCSADPCVHPCHPHGVSTKGGHMLQLFGGSVGCDNCTPRQQAAGGLQPSEGESRREVGGNSLKH